MHTYTVPALDHTELKKKKLSCKARGKFSFEFEDLVCF